MPHLRRTRSRPAARLLRGVALAALALAAAAAVAVAAGPTARTGERATGSAPGEAAPAARDWATPRVGGTEALRKARRRAREAARRAEAARLAGSGQVPDLLRRAFLLRALAPDEHRLHRRTWARARRAVQRLEGRRRGELRAVIDGVRDLARRDLLTPSRIPAAFLTLRHNVRLWTGAPLPRAGARRRVARGAVVLQHYPGHGWQVQPLASWGRINALARRCLGSSLRRRDDGRARTCPRQRTRLRARIDLLLALGVPRGGFLAWEYLFDYAQGRAPWISGMAQATAVQALARAGDALDEATYRHAARRALGAFEQPPPTGVGVRGAGQGRHYALYSFAPGLRVLNAELQAVLALRDITVLAGSSRARRLYLRGDRAVRAMLPGFDTGAWSLYSAGGREATAEYHRLQRRLLGRLCGRTGRGAYCAAHERFARYEHEAPRVRLTLPGRPRARRGATVAFALSKVSTVQLRIVDRRGATSLLRSLRLPRGRHQVRWAPRRQGTHRLRLEARGPTGPPRVVRRELRVRQALRRPGAEARAPGSGP